MNYINRPCSEQGRSRASNQKNRIKAGNDEDCGLIFQGYNHQNSDRGKARSSKPEAVLKP